MRRFNLLKAKLMNNNFFNSNFKLFSELNNIVNNNSLINNNDINNKISKAEELTKYIKCPISGVGLKVNKDNSIFLNADYIEYKYVNDILYLSEEHSKINL